MRKFETHEIQALGSGLSVFAETTDLDLISAGDLLDRFYRDLDPNDPLTCKPLGMALNPEVRGIRVFLYDDVWLVLYRRNYRVIIIKHSRYATGPHAARLQYVSYQTDQLFWIATLQIDNCMFFSEEQIYVHLITHIMNRDFYISDKSRKDIMAK